MNEETFTKVGVAGVMLGAVWLLGMGVDRFGGRQVTDQSATEGVLLPEVAIPLDPVVLRKEARHTALVALALPVVTAVDPGSVRVVTPGYAADASQARPVMEYRKPDKPKPRSIMLVLDNSKSMVISDGMSPPSDPEYRRLDACRRLLSSLSETADRVSLAIFPCRASKDTEHQTNHAFINFELIAQNKRPSEIAGMLDTLKNEENYTTPLYEGVEKGALAFGDDEGRQRVMVALTDGKDSRKDPEALRRAVAAVQSRGVETYGIALGVGADEAALRQLAPHVLKADDAEALDRTFKEVMEQISREVVQVDLDVVVSRAGDRIPTGQPIEVEFRSNGKLYRIKGEDEVIVYAKHLVLMSLALFAVPVVARFFAQVAGTRLRLRRPGVTFGFVLVRLLVAILLPLLAQGTFAWIGHRYVALVLTGAVYGATFGDAGDFPRIPGTIWGALGGAGAAFLYSLFPATSESRELCAALFAIAPLLAYRTTSFSARRRLGARGVIQPSRRILG